MGTASIKAGQAYVELYADDKPLVRALKKARDGLKSFSDKLVSVTLKMRRFENAALYAAGRVAVAIGALAAPLAYSAKTFADYGGKFEDMAFRTGMSTEALTEYAHVALMTGTSIEEMESAIHSMQTTLLGAAQGKKKALEVLKLLGLSYKQLADMAPEQQFETISDAIAEVEDPTLRAGVAMKMFGGSGSKLLPMLNEGADGIAAMRQEAKQLGLSMSGEDAAAAAQLGDSMDRLKQAFFGVMLAVGSALAPALTAAFNQIAPMIGAISEFIRNNTELVASILAFAGKGLLLAGVCTILSYAFAGLLGPTTMFLNFLLGFYPLCARVMSGFMSLAGGIRSLGAVMFTPLFNPVKMLGSLFGHVSKAGLLAFGVVGKAGSAALWGLCHPIKAVSLLYSGMTSLFVSGSAVIGSSLAQAGRGITFGLMHPIKTVSILFSGLTAIAGTVVTALGGVVSALGAIVGMPFLIIAAIVALVGAVFYFSGAGSALIKRVYEAFSGLYNGVTRSVKGIYNAIMAGDWGAAFAVLWTGIKALFAEGWNWIVATATECAGLLTQWFYQAFERIVGTEIAGWFADVFQRVTSVIGVAFTWIMDAWTMVSTGFMNGLSFVWEFIQITVTRWIAIFQFFFGWLIRYYKWAFGVLCTVTGWIVAYYKWAFGVVREVVGTAMNIVIGIFKKVYQVGKPIFDLLLTVASGIGNAFKTAFSTIWGIVKNLISSVSKLAGWALKFLDRLTGADKKIEKIQKNAAEARDERNQAAIDTIATRHGLKPGDVDTGPSAADQWEQALADVETDTKRDEPATDPASGLLGGLQDAMNPESFSGSNFEMPEIAMPNMEDMQMPLDNGALSVTFDDSALKDWESALERANDARKGIDTGDVAMPGLDAKRTSRVRGLLDTDHGKEAEKLSSAGTFSAFDAAALGNNVQKDIASNTQETVKELKTIRRNANVGFEFT